MPENPENLIVVYDLGSENITRVSQDVRNRIRSIRVQSTRLLHKLGVMCTQSVIIVSPNNVDRVQETIAKVKALYSTIGIESVKPVIKVLNITQEQQTELLEFSKRLLQEKVDNDIDRITELIEEIRTINDDNQLRRIRYNLTRTKRELQRLYENSRQLGLEIRDFRYLLSLYDEAIELTYSESQGGGLW